MKYTVIGYYLSDGYRHHVHLVAPDPAEAELMYLQGADAPCASVAVIPGHHDIADTHACIMTLDALERLMEQGSPSPGPRT